jgi:dTDP-4-dehydrorhamnose 3,5-epimerase
METPDGEFRLRPMSGDGIELLPGLLVIEPQVHADARGHFFESFNAQGFAETVESGLEFVQDNQSRSAQDVLRGLHYQLAPRAQGKLVRVVRGAVFDVAVDIRRSSPAFGSWFGIELSEDNFKQLWIPPGFAHGFLALTDPADLLYKVTAYYSPEHDRSIRWDDPDIGIEWPIDGEPILSEKDASAPYLAEADVFA